VRMGAYGTYYQRETGHSPEGWEPLLLCTDGSLRPGGTLNEFADLVRTGEGLGQPRFDQRQASPGGLNSIAGFARLVADLQRLSESVD
jgi:hypothetical protein